VVRSPDAACPKPLPAVPDSWDAVRVTGERHKLPFYVGDLAFLD
jgi:hypothetical protein